MTGPNRDLSPQGRPADLGLELLELPLVSPAAAGPTLGRRARRELARRPELLIYLLTAAVAIALGYLIGTIGAGA